MCSSDLISIFQSRSDQRKLALKDKLIKIKMEKGNSIPKYLTKFVHYSDELGRVGELGSPWAFEELA